MIFKFRVHKVRPYWSTATPIHSCIVSGCSHTRKAEPLNATDNMGSTKAKSTVSPSTKEVCQPCSTAVPCPYDGCLT